MYSASYAALNCMMCSRSDSRFGRYLRPDAFGTARFLVRDAARLLDTVCFFLPVLFCPGFFRAIRAGFLDPRAAFESRDFVFCRRVRAGFLPVPFRAIRTGFLPVLFCLGFCAVRAGFLPVPFRAIRAGFLDPRAAFESRDFVFCRRVRADSSRLPLSATFFESLAPSLLLALTSFLRAGLLCACFLIFFEILDFDTVRSAIAASIFFAVFFLCRISAAISDILPPADLRRYSAFCLSLAESANSRSCSAMSCASFSRPSLSSAAATSRSMLSFWAMLRIRTPETSPSRSEASSMWRSAVLRPRDDRL